MSNNHQTHQPWLTDLIYVDGRFQSGRAVVCDDCGNIVALTDNPTNATRLCGRAMLPGMVNAHSHAFQRMIRGRTEHRSQHSTDSFWTWREQMYSAANTLEPDDLYAVSRLAFHA